MTGVQHDTPSPQRVRYNDWRQVELPAPGAFVPERPVSVIVPYCAQPEELGRTLAALEGQTYPRELFEVVVVDDGSPEPLERPSTPLDVKVVRQEDLGFGLARARNTGVRAAAHDILLFLDADLLPEADWLAAHARWHHAVPDAVTVGLRVHVQVDGVDAGAIRSRPGTLKELFAGRNVDLVERQWFESHLRRTGDLTSRADDLFLLTGGSNLGVRRGFHDLVGGFDESFTQWGEEDTEFGYRACTRGGLLVPVREAFAWHQGLREEGQAEKEWSLKLQRAKTAHLIAHPRYRTGTAGRTFTVPQYVVTVRGAGLSADRLLEAVERVLSGPMHDLVVRLELPEGHAGRAWLERHLGPDPRVRVAPSRSALEEFPASPFHVTLPAGRWLHGDVVRRLRAGLGTAVVGRSEFPDGTRVSIVRAWALHRALRTPWEAADFGDVVTIPPRKLRAAPVPAGSTVRALRPSWDLLRAELRRVDGPGAAWRFVRWFGGAALRRVSGRFRAALPWKTPVMPVEAPASAPRAEYSLGVEIVALGARSRAVFEASGRVAWRTTAGPRADVVVADTAAEASGVVAPVVVLAEAPALLSVPAVDPLRHNPIGWQRDVDGTVGAPGPLDRLPVHVRADCVVHPADGNRIRSLHHLEDVQAFHPDATARAATLVRLAALGTVVHLADEAPHMEALLGAELYGLMAGAAPDPDPAAREALSIRTRRAALREHSLRSRARQLCAHAGVEPPLPPLVSVLLVTKRPALLAHALAGLARQTYPRVELVLGLHGDGFTGVERCLADLSMPATVVRVDSAQPLGAALNSAVAASGGTLLTKMDDDDVYGCEHLWDLVLAHEYSQAHLVGKTSEFTYLAASDMTVQMHRGCSEEYGARGAGGALLVSREVLDRVGGFPCVPHSVDLRLFEEIRGHAGRRVYRTHGAGYVLVRHGEDHTWDTVGDEWFLDEADSVWLGWAPDRACIADMDASYMYGPFARRVR